MPWRGPKYPGELATLGYLVAEWIQTYCVIPDRELRAPFPVFRFSDTAWLVTIANLAWDRAKILPP